MNATLTVLGSLSIVLGASVQPPAQPAAPSKATAAQPAEPAKETVFSFDRDSKGKLPEGWKAEGTNQKGPVATWEVVEDKTAPSGTNVLALTKTNHDSTGTFNICWTDTVKFKDGAIEVRFKPVSGKEDQGGGIIWRVKDRDNYMIARMNPLEDNFRVYYVKDGSRHQIESAKIVIKAGDWHTMRIEQHGDHVACFLDGKEYLNAKDDHIAAEGGVGLWTKSDAVSSFDDLRITPGAPDTTATKPAKPDGKDKKDKDDDDDGGE